MPNECMIQFYFRAEDLKKLLKANPEAKGIIVSQEISREKPKGTLNYINVAHIRATVDMGQAAKIVKGAKSMKAADEPEPPQESIDGCPFPPGCTP